MKTVTVRISDEDYVALVRHLARRFSGKRLVAVEELVVEPGDGVIPMTVEDLVDDDDDEDDFACPTCGNKPGDGVGCNDPDGCGFESGR